MSYGYTLLRDTLRTAKKQHRCIWCGEPILPGEKYRDERSVYDGSMQYHKWHLECTQAAQDEFSKYGDTEFMPYDNERPEKINAVEEETKTQDR